ncbi:Gp15 family bacteriophage protein [Bacillus subtilis]
MKLTDRFEEDVIEFKGRRIKLRLFFDVVLRAFELLEDEEFTEAQKWSLLAFVFAENKEDVEELSLDEKVILVKAIFDNFIHEPGETAQDSIQQQPQSTNEDEQNTSEGEQSTSKKDEVFDFEQDAEYIYASFLFDYNLDLFEQQGKLHWRKFQALLKGLSEDAKFSKVIEIRTMKLPKEGEERKRIQELKRIYALNKKPVDEEAAIKELDAKASAFFQNLRGRGGKK